MPNALVRAAAEGLPSISRRQVLSLAASSAAATTLATISLAQPAEHPDIDLLWLDQEMAEAEAQMNGANKACERVGRKADKLFPPRPANWEEPTMPGHLHEMYAGMLVRDLAFPEKWPAPLRAWQKAIDERRAAYRALQEAHQDKVDGIYREAGIDAAEAAYSARSAEFFRVGHRILAMPAATLEGILVKLRAADKIAAEKEALISIAADIRRLAGEAA
ncbi:MULTISPECIES: hypothetical protein [unclassified Mesorhizobium]|uniref:hypothetical protein n=1 Tax=unclassified Mesorhizobium TaxID=325217 RepID=UPI000FCBFF1B|nr:MULTISPECIES: hypothetical protein [unclassified Mesorhizobium]RUV63192.1 hypothetical protein EOA85_04045 [Mesorhizobium sp. M5C.F.Ca.IN.020.29.1.1]RWJ02500.1 MAG: hypothetical protein EOR23_21100 [Mesorhizobium sp.]RWJ30437.1 MAG: hypothetical protein EOR28_18285 [Mesorhizobium sp.]TIM84754.1 MAG: hypothetical protein E5Y50_21155 [Mesorhizobium sp.]TIP75386.1 MAG: hypothetical protein E5X55_04240 [Mesorhizobium sp.]